MVAPTPEMCIACKGSKGLCGEPCILLARIDNRLPKLRITNQDVAGTSPPSVFVGRFGYPKVNVGPLLPPIQLDPDRATDLGSPQAWTHGTIQDVLGMRSTLLRTRTTLRVRDAQTAPKILEVTRELALSGRPVDTEVHLVKKPNLEMLAQVGDVSAPMGPSVEADRARLTQNARVDSWIDRAYGDVHARATDVVGELYQRGLDHHRIEPLLSLGLLGRARERRLVPTRWSITATDDMLGKRLIDDVLDRPTIDSVEYYKSSLHGNEFHVLLAPRTWFFDMIEVWIRGAMWALETSDFIQDWEDWRGRRSYASNITGAYYSARLGVLEHLHKRRRQAAVFVYREITPDYWAPLGVWLIREAVRRAMATRPATFETLWQAMQFVHERTRVKGWPNRSRLADDARHQRRLTDFV